MPTWVWLFLALTALGLLLRQLDAAGLDATERFGKPLTILLILALIAGLVLSFVYADWR